MSFDFSGAFALVDDREEALVIDNPEDPLAQEVEVHVCLHEDDGRWHKLLPNHSATSCGKKFNVTRVTLRREALEHAHAMCPTCFTDYERLLATDADAKVRRDTLEVEPINLREWLDMPGPDRPTKRKKP